MESPGWIALSSGEAKRNGHMGTVLEAITENFGSVAGRLLVSDAGVLLLGVFPILVVYGLRHCGTAGLWDRPHPSIRHFGRHVLVLNLYFNPDFAVGIDPLWMAMMVTAIEHCLNEISVRHKAAPTTKDIRMAYTVKSSYGDLGRAFHRIVQLFLCQTCLIFFYIYHMTGNEGVHDYNRPNFLFWVLAVALTERVSLDGDDGVGNVYNALFWDTLLDKLYSEEYTLVLRDLLAVRRTRLQWILRSWFAWLVNTVFRILLMTTLPVLLCTEDSLDFIKDIVAVNLITRLDDMETSQSLGGMVESLKWRHLHRRMTELSETLLSTRASLDKVDRQIQNHLQDNPQPGNN